MTKADKGRVALRAFFKIAKVWLLTDEEQLCILGQPDNETFDAWRRDEGAVVAKDTLERISSVLGIFHAINSLVPDKQIAADWVRSPNDRVIEENWSARRPKKSGNRVLRPKLFESF